MSSYFVFDQKDFLCYAERDLLAIAKFLVCFRVNGEYGTDGQTDGG